MRFAEADQEYRNLENQFRDGEILEDDFLVQVAQLRVVDQEGRRWMVSPRTGRWMVHDGQQWVFADPPREEPEPEPEEIESAETGTIPAAATIAAAQPPPRPPGPKPVAPRLMASGLTAILLVACVISAGISAWVFFLRDWGAVTSTPVQPTQVSAVQTYTPRPATPTYTPTSTPTPSRTPTPTITSIPTDTPVPTDTPPPTNTPIPINSPTPTWTPLVLASTQEPTGDVPQPTEAAAVAPTPTALVTSTPQPSQTYTVKQGDTLFEIAQKFGVTVDAIAKANGITNIKLIRPGQVLVIPPPGTTPQPPTPTSQLSSTPTTQPTTVAATTSTPQPTPATAVAEVSPTPTTTGVTPTPGSTATPSGPTATPVSTAAPTIAPTAKPETLTGKIAFTVWNPYIGKYELYVSRIDGGGRNMLGEGFRQPQFRQDGNLLAANGDGAPNYEHLVTMNPSGGELREVSQHTEDSYPSWSPDGAIVAYSSDSWGDGVIRVGIVNDMFGKQQDWIHYGQTEIRGEFPFWMSDGRVVYHGCDFMGDHAACGLFWVGAGGGRYNRLTTHQSDSAPTGTGSRIVFMSARDGNWEIYAVNIDGTGLKRLTQNNAQDGLPTFSPDGKSLAFVSNRDGAWAIWVMNANGSNQRKLFNLGGGYGSGAYDWTRERISWAP